MLPAFLAALQFTDPQQLAPTRLLRPAARRLIAIGRYAAELPCCLRRWTVFQKLESVIPSSPHSDAPHVLCCRQLSAGDQLRVFYENLSKDPNSLANLDQVRGSHCSVVRGSHCLRMRGSNCTVVRGSQCTAGCPAGAARAAPAAADGAGTGQEHSILIAVEI